MLKYFFIFLFLGSIYSSSQVSSTYFKQSSLKIEFVLVQNKTQTILHENVIVFVLSKIFFNSFGQKLSYNVQLPSNKLQNIYVKIIPVNSNKQPLKVSYKKWKLTQQLNDWDNLGLYNLFSNSIFKNAHKRLDKIFTGIPRSLEIILYGNDMKYHGIVNQMLTQNPNNFININKIKQQIYNMKVSFSYNLLYTSLDVSSLSIVQYIQLFIENIELISKTNITDQQIKLFTQYGLKYIQVVIKQHETKINNMQQHKNQNALAKYAYDNLVYEKQSLNYVHYYINVSKNTPIFTNAIQILKKIVLEFSSIFIQTAKDIIKLNKPQILLWLLYLFLGTLSLQNVAWLWLLHLRKVSKNYGQKHINYSMVYPLISFMYACICFVLYTDYLYYYGILIWIYYRYLLDVYIQRTPNFPYRQFKVPTYLEQTKNNDYKFLKNLFKILIAYRFGKFVVNMFFQSYFDQQRPQSMFQTFSLFIYQNLYTISMFAQWYQNKQARSVRHLTKWYLFLIFMIAIKDNYLILFGWRKIFNYLIVFADDIAFILIMKQVFQYNDLGLGTRHLMDDVQPHVPPAVINRFLNVVNNPNQPINQNRNVNQETNQNLPIIPNQIVQQQVRQVFIQDGQEDGQKQKRQ